MDIGIEVDIKKDIEDLKLFALIKSIVFFLIDIPKYFTMNRLEK